MEIEFDFDELCPRSVSGQIVTGMMLCGTAELSNDGETDQTIFHVSSVTLQGSATVTWQMAKAFPHSFDAAIFKVVSSELEDDRTGLGESAGEAFAKALEQEAQDHAEGLADYRYEMMRDREMEGAE